MNPSDIQPRITVGDRVRHPTIQPHLVGTVTEIVPARFAKLAPHTAYVMFAGIRTRVWLSDLVPATGPGSAPAVDAAQPTVA